MADNLGALVPEESFIGGCPDPTAGRALIIPAGPASTAVFQMRDSAGNPINLTPFQTAPAGFVAYAADVFCPIAPVTTLTATVLNAAEGKLSILLPTSLTATPGIYKVEIWAVSDVGDVPHTSVYKDELLVSIEASLMMRATNTNDMLGPLTIGEVRTQLRDFAELNEYWQQREYSTAEIVHSLMLPIYTFNETPPPVKLYNGNNFPYRAQWLDGVVANLTRIAASWLLRNARTIKYADGTTESDKDKFEKYYQIAEQRWQMYRQFCRDQKIAINLRTGSSIH